jgi:iron complex outermembrane receptor protein
MKKFLLFIFLTGSFILSAQTGTLKGTVTGTDGEPLPGVSVYIQSIKKGGETDYDGKYTIVDIPVGTYSVSYSFLGFTTANKSVEIKANSTTTVDIVLSESLSKLDEVVVTANKKPQKLTEVPATVNVISAKDIQQFSSFNVGELAARQKGVDFVRSGVLGTGLNIRGFNSAFNAKNLQVTDDRLSTLIATGLPFGTFSTVTKDDIEKVEILLGPNGTLYGPNAHNGLVSTITKNPRTSEGTTVTVGAGNQNVLTTRFRHAQKVGDKFSYKVHFERSAGTEFQYVDSVYVGNVAYEELDLDRDFSTVKYGAGLFYQTGKSSELSMYYGHSNNNNLAVTNAGRNQIKDWKIDILQVKFTSKRFFANFYHTWSNTDETYAINQRTQNYVSYINNGFSEAEARERSFFTQWFPTGPGTGIELDRGAVFKDASRRINSEVQYNNTWGGFSLATGIQFQRDMADSKGTYLLDANGSININQTGYYTQMEYKFGDSGWNALFGARFDNHDLYGSNFLPKVALSNIQENGSWRFTFGRGIAVPSILNLQGNLFGGLLIGNGEGFTLSDGSTVEKLQVETINSFEVGYKGKISNKLFIDANAYYNISENFLSPALNIADAANGIFVTQVGDTPIGDIIPGSTGAAFLLTYLNFGKVDTYGLDIGLNYYFTDRYSLTANYSYFGQSIDKNDLGNDGNRDGIVTDTELPINTPANKLSIGLNYSDGKYNATIFGRWVQKYDFFSGINIAAETQDTNGDGVDDVFENARNGRTWNYGQLGGFMVDVNGGYNVNKNIYIGASITNLFNAEVREFVASPVIGTLASLEFKYTFF